MSSSGRSGTSTVGVAPFASVAASSSLRKAAVSASLAGARPLRAMNSFSTSSRTASGRCTDSGIGI
eukprot:6178441-Pleurochrysis_carterae.AAC.1